jgi:YidC/Oxa1 family membrane protein insertase
MGAIMFLSPYFFKSAAPPPAAKKSAPVSAQTTPPSSPAPPATAQAEKAATPVSATSVAATQQQALPPLVIENRYFKVTFSNQGANVRSWILKNFKGNDGKPLDLMNSAAGNYPFSLFFPGTKPATDVNWAWFQEKVDPNGLGVTYTYSDGHTAVTKTFRFQRESYLSEITSSVTIDGQPVPHAIVWRGGFGDLTIGNPAAGERALYFNVADNKLVEQTAKVAQSGPVTVNGNFSFAGVADTYFAAVFLPEGDSTMQVTTLADTARTVLNEKPEPLPGIAVSNGTENRFSFFVGPKDVDLLRRVNPKLEQVVDFGWLAVLAKPLFLLVNWVNDVLIHNFGWAIVIVTIIINFVLFPLKLANMKSMRKMQALQPQIAAINEKYKNIGLRDPRKTEQNQEVMDLYKKHGVNPMGGCLPMALQIPFFFAFYKVFTVSVEMRGASWLWVGDLSQPEHLAIRILPIIMIASQFLMQKMMPQTNADPNQQRMMMFMPLIFGFMFYNLPSGLVLYYLTSNLVSMGQQWFFNHTAAAEEAARSVEPPKKRNGRK